MLEFSRSTASNAEIFFFAPLSELPTVFHTLGEYRPGVQTGDQETDSPLEDVASRVKGIRAHMVAHVLVSFVNLDRYAFNILCFNPKGGDEWRVALEYAPPLVFMLGSFLLCTWKLGDMEYIFKLARREGLTAQ